MATTQPAASSTTGTRFAAWGTPLSAVVLVTALVMAVADLLPWVASGFVVPMGTTVGGGQPASATLNAIDLSGQQSFFPGWQLDPLIATAATGALALVAIAGRRGWPVLAAGAVGLVAGTSILPIVKDGAHPGSGTVLGVSNDIRAGVVIYGLACALLTLVGVIMLAAVWLDGRRAARTP
jgi:hypothetical protein